MSAYYYVMASLPFLVFDAAPHVTLEKFLEFAEAQLSEPDWKILRQTALGNVDVKKKINPLFRRFQEWEISLRNRLALLRAEARKLEGGRFLRQAPLVVEAARVARAALEAADPLAAEETLDRGRFEFLSSLELGHQFDIEALIVYRLKLELLERKARLRSEAGQAEFGRLGAEIGAAIAEKQV